MVISEQAIVTDAADPARRTAYIHWSAVFVGALVAVATSLVLTAFGLAIGLSVSPSAPTWRSASWLLGLLSGLWVLVVAVGSLAAGGYLAGRIRATWILPDEDQVEFRDGSHGLAVWGIAVAAGAVISALTLGAISHRGDSALGESGSYRPVGGQSFPVAYEVDRLFRADQVTDVAPGIRQEAGRLFVASLETSPGSAADRTQLARIVAATTRMPVADAQSRVDQAVAAARDKIAAARRAATILAFITAASLLVAAVTAWFTAIAGGKHRDMATPPSLVWRPRALRVVVR
jgi:hypothetical protein